MDHFRFQSARYPWIRLIVSIVGNANRALTRLGSLLRVHQWLQYKISPLLTPLYFLALHNAISFREGAWAAAALIVYFLSTAGLAFFLNDLSDIESDARSGKTNLVSQLSLRQRILGLIGLLGASIVSLLLLPFSLPLYGLALAELLCFVAYSFRPFRFKEGYLGIIVDALYAHVLPFAITVSAVAAVTPLTEPLPVMAGWLALLWQLSQGVRHILGHQLADFDGDRRAHVKTFAVRIGKRRARWLYRYATPLLEMTSYIALLVTVPYGNLALALHGAFMVGVGVRYFSAIPRDCRPHLDPYFYDRILTDFYIAWLPVLLLVILAAASPGYIVVLCGQLLLFGLPRVGSVPSPPSWQVDLRLRERDTEGNSIVLEGWYTKSALAPVRIELRVDGWPIARAMLDCPVPEKATHFARSKAAFCGFEGEASLAYLSRNRQIADVQVIAILANGASVRLQREWVSLPSQAGRDSEAEWACVYANDWRSNLLRDGEDRPERIVVVHPNHATEVLVEPALRNALDRLGFQIVSRRAGETDRNQLHDDCLRLGRKVLLCMPAADWNLETAQLFRVNGWFCISFQIESGENSRVSPEFEASLDFIGPFTTPVYDRFASRFLGVAPPANAIEGSSSQTKAA